MKVEINGRIGRGLQESGFLTLAYNQYEKGENKTIWVDVFIPEYLREKARALEKGWAVRVSGRLDFRKEEYEGKTRARITLMAESIRRSLSSNGMSAFFLIGGRLGKDVVLFKNGGGVLSVAYNTFYKGTEETRWVSVFLNKDLVEKINKMGIKKGSRVDIIGSRFLVDINDAGYLDAVMGAADIGYGEYIPNKDDDKKVQNKEDVGSDDPFAEEKKPVKDEAPSEKVNKVEVEDTSSEWDDFEVDAFEATPEEDDFEVDIDDLDWF